MPEPVNKKMCATCPWREGSPYAYLRPDLEMSAMTKASRICHSTGPDNAINQNIGKPAMICRGARDFQLKIFHGMGFLKEPTDECWDRKWKEMSNA